ncbi:DUF6350 family protein [Kytococcus sedentarius]|uniref:cell division protein PerM n=1 Tax=Kytococcus sedentarius TaxID=1276 RepID=UPI0035BC539C
MTTSSTTARTTARDRAAARAPATGASALAAGAGWGVLVTLLAHALVAGLAFAAWVSAPSSTLSAAQAGREGVRLTQLAQGARLEVGDPLAVAGEVTRWSLVGGPTLVTLAWAGALFWTLRRLVRGLFVDPDLPGSVPAAAVAGGVTGAVATSLALGLAVGSLPEAGGLVRWLVLMTCTAALACGAGALAGSPARRVDGWFSGWPGNAGEVLQDAAGPALRAASLLALAGLVALVALLAAGFDQVVAVHGALAPGTLGSAVLVLAQVGWLPTLLLWAVAWLSGAGLVVGDASATPHQVPEVTLPAIPVLGAVPDAGTLPQAWWLVLLTGVAVGALLPGAVRGRLAEFVEDATWLDVAWRCLVAGLLVGAGVSFLGLHATMGVAPGPLSVVAPSVWAGPAVAGQLVLGAALRLAVERVVSRPA